jgi:hypothetical protein
MHFSKRCLVRYPRFSKVASFASEELTVPYVDPLTVCQHLDGQALSRRVLVPGVNCLGVLERVLLMGRSINTSELNCLLVLASAAWRPQFPLQFRDYILSKS